MANSDFTGGYSLWVDSEPAAPHLSLLGVEFYRQTSNESCRRVMSRSRCCSRQMRHAGGSGGKVTLWANDKQIGEGRLDKTVPIAFTSYAGMDIGRDNGGVVDLDYEEKAPYAFNGTVKKVVFDLMPAQLDAQGSPAPAQRRQAVAAGVIGTPWK